MEIEVVGDEVEAEPAEEEASDVGTVEGGGAEEEPWWTKVYNADGTPAKVSSGSGINESIESDDDGSWGTWQAMGHAETLRNACETLNNPWSCALLIRIPCTCK